MIKRFHPYKIDVTELSIYITNRCNKKCKHCFINQNNDEVKPEWIQWVMSNFPNITKAVIVGGEPTICKTFPEIVKILKENDVKITMSTNCQWMRWDKRKKKPSPDEKGITDVLDMIKDIDSIQISIEGSKKTTDEIRGKGTYDDCMGAVDLLKKNKFDVFFRATYSNNNFNEIPSMLELATEKKVHLILFPYKGRDSIPLSNEAQELLYNKLLEYTSKGGERLAIANIPQYYTYIGQHGYCPAGRNIINIIPDGTITPCEMNMPPDHYPLAKFKNNGNLMDKDFLLKRMQTFLEEVKKIDQECMTCKHHPTCRSGCHETREYMDCPLKYNVDYEVSVDYAVNKKDMRIKKRAMKKIMNKRKGC